MKTFQHLGLTIDLETHKKLKLLSEYEGRTISGEILTLIRMAIFKHEKKYGKLE